MKKSTEQLEIIWKIIQYNSDGTQHKKRIGDTKIGYEKALRAVKRYKTYTYKVFILRGKPIWRYVEGNK